MLKTINSPYLCNRLTDFDEIWHDDAYWPPYSGKAAKILNFWKYTMAAAAMLKITKKSRYIRNGLTDLYEIWYAGAKWVS